MSENEIKSAAINWEYMLNRFWCGHHMKESLIVVRGPEVFALDCGCAYRITPDRGTKWLNTTAPSNDDPNKTQE